MMELSLNLGYTRSGSPVVWRGGDNPHISISGRSGAGKSFFLKHLIRQTAEQGVACVVFDYSDDFRGISPSDDMRFQRIGITSPEFRLNPLIATSENQTADVCAQRLLSVLHSVFRMGSRASLELQQNTRKYLLYVQGRQEVPSLNGLDKYISATVKKMSAGLYAALERLSLLADLIRCGDEPISLDFAMPGVIVLDFEGVVDRDFRKILIEIILQAIWDKRTSDKCSQDCPVILVLDEAHNLSWKEDSMAVRILREGRKYDLAGWFSSQWFDNKTASSALNQAALQVHFRPDDENVNRLAKKLCPNKADTAQYQSKVQSLRRGQFLWQRSDGRLVIAQVRP